MTIDRIPDAVGAQVAAGAAAVALLWEACKPRYAARCAVAPGGWWRAYATGLEVMAEGVLAGADAVVRAVDAGGGDTGRLRGLRDGLTSALGAAVLARREAV